MERKLTHQLMLLLNAQVLYFSSYTIMINVRCSIAPTFTGFQAYSTNAFAMHAKAAPQLSIASSLSPRLSPRVNPFSATSPAHNPFMSFVDKQDDLWKSFSRHESTSTTSKSTTSGITPVFGGFSDSTTSFGNFQSNPPVQPIFGSSNNNNANNAIGSTNKSLLERQMSVNNDEENEEDEAYSSKDEEESEELLVEEKNTNLVLQNVITGEEEETCLLQLRSKMFRLGAPKEKAKCIPFGSSSSNNNINHREDEKESNGAVIKDVEDQDKDNASIKNNNTPQFEWIEVGTGPLKVLKSELNSSHRMVLRRENSAGGSGTKLLLNLLLKPVQVHICKLGEKAIRVTGIDCVTTSVTTVEPKEDADNKSNNTLSIPNGSPTSTTRTSFVPVTYLFRVKTTQVSIPFELYFIYI